jgi:NitT/TauT family transport system substrate-binding protein
MKPIARRHLLRGAAALAAAPALGAWAADAPATLRLSGPSASVSNPLIHLAALRRWPGLAESIGFTPWRDPDQLRALALREGADFVAMPTNVAANLYNRGVPLKLVNVSVWGILYLVSRDAGRKTLADYRGEEIAMPFREDMPDLVFQETAQALGLNPKADFQLRYVASPLDAMQLLITRRVRHALLAEPAVSMALRKTQSFPVSAIAPELHRAVDLQQEWARAFQRPPRIAQAGIVALGRAAQDTALMQRLAAAYAEAAGWCQANRAACGAEVAAVEPRLTAEAVADSLGVAGLQPVPAAQARGEVMFLFERLLRRNPQLLGGKLPDAGFFAA